MKSKFRNIVNLKQKSHTSNICEHITITITNKASTKVNKISFTNYFLSFLKFTGQLANAPIVKKNTNTDSFKIITKLKAFNADIFLKYLSTYILPNRQKFKKYKFENNLNIISFHIDEWVNLMPGNSLIPVFQRQPSMQIVIVLNKNLTTQDAFMFLSSLNFPIIAEKTKNNLLTNDNF